MLAITRRIWTARVTGLEAKCVCAHKVVPINDLAIILVSGTRVAKCSRVDKSSERVTALVSTGRVHFTTKVISSNVDLGLVDVSGHLNVIWGANKLDTLNGAFWEETGPMAGFGAIRHSFSFSIADERVGFGWAPETPIASIVDDGRLT